MGRSTARSVDRVWAGDRQRPDRPTGRREHTTLSPAPKIAAPMKSRAVHNFSILIASELTGQAIAFGLGAYLARKLGAQGFGVWAYAASIVTYLLIVVDGGTEVWGQREVSAHPGRLRQLIVNVGIVRLTLVLLAIVVLLVVAAASPVDHRWALIFGIGSLLVFVAQTSWAHRGLESVGPATSNLVQRVLMAGLAFSFIHSPSQGAEVMLWQSLSDGAGALVLLLLLWPRLSIRSASERVPTPSAVLRAAWPLGASRILRGLPHAATMILLGANWPISEVAHFGVATRIALAVLVVSSVFSLVTFPALTRAHLAGGQSEQKATHAAVRLFALIFTPAIVGLVMVAHPFVVMAFSHQYVASVRPLQLLGVGFFMTGLTDNLRRLLHARHQQALDLRLVFLATTVGLGSASLLVPKHGALGAGWALILGEAALLGLILFAIRRAGLTLGLLQAFAFPACASILMAGAIGLLGSNSLAVSVLAGAAVYGSVMLFRRKPILADLSALELDPEPDQP